jgi:OmcA/MtrC family decaheme c-type cytochrome
VVCHNPKAEIKGAYGYSGWDNVSLINLVHGIHREKNLGNATTSEPDGWDFTEVTYPQDIRNCTTCHQGTDDFWKTRPTRYNCNSCHDVDFATGAGHGPGNIGGPRANDSACAICHAPEAIVFYHAAQNETPTNVPPYLDNIVYFIDNVTVDNNVPVVGFRITKNGAPMTLTTWPPAGYDNTSGPTFLVAYTMSQDGITTPADYNNLGKTAAQPAEVTLRDLSGKLTGGPSGYTAKLTSAPFPAGAKMRAVALQSYFTQLPDYDVDGDGVINSSDAVGRHTPAVMKPVNGDTQRRTVVDSSKCLGCHKALELHGGSRVNNVQVCVMCHNPNLSSSGRTTPAGTTPVWGAGPKEGESASPPLSTDPLTWPERTNNLKELVHGIHASEMRGTENPYQFVRLRRGTAYYFDWSEVTYPAQLRNCTKCHVNPKSTDVPKYEAVLPAGVLMTTEETTTSNNTETGITAARKSVPNSTDVVNSPTASGCGFCHDDAKGKSHMVLQGGQIKATRGQASSQPPPLAPAFAPTP